MSYVQRKSNLLAVDWDFFFESPWRMSKREYPNVWLYDWGHAERGDLYRTILWTPRAMGFIKAGLPLPDTTGEEVGFWDRFNIDPEAEIFFGDSNVLAAHEEVRDGVKEVWLYDQHHDSGYSQSYPDVFESKTVTCEDWMYFYAMQGSELHVRYPRWATGSFDADPVPQIEVDRQFDSGKGPDIKFDRVFVCRSDAWTPSWADNKFQKFIEGIPGNEITPLDDYSDEPREFDINAAQIMAKEELKWLEKQGIGVSNESSH